MSPRTNELDSSAEAFRNNIRRILRRWDPEEYLPVAAKLLRLVQQDSDKARVWPPHLVLHTIEANCAFFRPEYSTEPVTTERHNQLMGLYKDFESITHLHYLQNRTDWGDFELFFMSMAKQQFGAQREDGKYDVARAILLFLSPKLEKSDSMFQEYYGLSFREWIIFCIGITANSSVRKHLVIEPGYFTNATHKLMPDHSVEKAFKLASQSVQQVKNEFYRMREGFNARVELNLPRIIDRRPLIELGDGKYLVSHIPFVLRLAVEGLYDHCSHLPGETFAHDFGDSFEAYVGMLLHQIKDPTTSVLEESDLVDLVNGHVCDYLIKNADSVILIECKAIDYTATFLSPKAIKGTNFTKRVSEALGQISNVASQLRTNTSFQEAVGEIGDRSVIGVIVTYRKFFLANGEVFTQILSESATTVCPHDEPLESLFTWRPQVLDIKEFEQLVRYGASGNPIREAFAEKLCRPLTETGDWETYFNQSIASETTLPILDDTFNSFFNKIIGTLVD